MEKYPKNGPARRSLLMSFMRAGDEGNMTRHAAEGWTR